ncbi:MAG: potassium-transporting ATPase subunit B, partial [Raoultibacter sp.]
MTTTTMKKNDSTAQMVRALKEAFAKLDPRQQVGNPVMLMVYISALLTSLLFMLSLFGVSDSHPGFIFAIAFVLWITVLFANFAEAIAEGRGKA